jgi:xylulokinase
MPVHTSNTLPKLMWLKEHEPLIWKKASRFLLYEDFIINKLTGKPVISKCLASRTQAFDLVSEKWSENILDFLELEKSRLAEIQHSGAPVERMNAKLAEELGFKTLPIVAVGGHDQACGALGAGLTKAGLAMVSTGTAEVVEVSMDSPHLNDSLYNGNMSVYLHAFPGLYVVMTLNQSGGFVLRWFRDTFCQYEREIVKTHGGDAYDMVLKGAGPEPSPVMMLPHLAGSGTPTLDTHSGRTNAGASVESGCVERWRDYHN